jgi:hypothetical protein
VGTNDGICAVFVSTVPSLRSDCTVQTKRVKKKMLFGNAGCAGFSVFRFSGKKSFVLQGL